MLNGILSKIGRFIKSDLFWILVVSVTINNIYYNINSYINYNADSVTYYSAAQKLFKGYIDMGRPPVYPFLIKIFELVSPSPPFKTLILFQYFASFISIIFFYFISKRITKLRIFQIFATVIYGILPSIYSMNNAIFAESILISSMIGFVFLFYIFLMYPSKVKAVLLNLSVFFLVMIKPICLIFYVVMALIWIYRIIKKKDISFLRIIIVSYILSVGLVLGYSQINKIQNNYWGVSSIKHDNDFINVIFSSAYKNIPDQDFVNTVDSTLHKTHYYVVYYLNNYHDYFKKGFDIFPLEYSHKRSMTGIESIPSNELGYSLSNIQSYIKEAMLTKEYINYTSKKLIRFLDAKIGFVNGMFVYFLILGSLCYLVFSYIKRKSLDESMIFHLLVICGLLGVFIIGGVMDGTIHRVLIPFQPFIILLSFSLLDKVWAGIKKQLPLTD